VSAEEAQSLANQGHPTVASWHNPGGIGHIAVVRPGEVNERGPAIAQAGGSNSNEGHVRDSLGNAPVQYFVNDRGTATQGSPQPAPTDPASPSEPDAPAAQAPRFSVPQNDLQRGMQSGEVDQLQTALVDLGYMTQAQKNTGPGTFGPQTEASLKRFQADHGVPSTGYYGPLTRAALTQKAGGTTGPGPVGPVGPTPEPGGAGSVSVEQLRGIMPNLSDARARELMPHLNAAMQEAGINTPRRQAAFLAQLAHESGEFRYMEEIASGAAYEGRLDLGNTQPGDGVRFKGRGPIQLTGRNNYRAAGQALGIDLENNPARAAEPDVGFRTAAWFWNSRNLNAAADAGNFDYITYRVNGGYNGKASRDAYYARALQVLGA
jgi:predicted chitinase